MSAFPSCIRTFDRNRTICFRSRLLGTSTLKNPEEIEEDIVEDRVRLSRWKFHNLPLGSGVLLAFREEYCRMSEITGGKDIDSIYGIDFRLTKRRSL